MIYLKNLTRHPIFAILLLACCFLGLNPNSIASAPEEGSICVRLVRAGRLQKCIELAEATQQLDSGFLAQVYYLAGRYKSAISAIDKTTHLTADEPSKAECFALRGLCNYKLGLYDNALEDFTNAIKLPDYPPAIYQNRALVYEKLGDQKRALDDKEKAPNASVYHIDLEYYQSQSFGVPLVEVQAGSDFDKGDRLKWQHAMKLVRDAEKLEAKNQLDNAVKNYQDAIVFYPNDPQFYAALGLCLTTRKSPGDQSEAIKDFRDAVALSSHDWRLWNDLGALLYGDKNEQEKDEEKNKRYLETKHAFQMALSEGKDLEPMQKQALLKCSNTTDSVSELSKQIKLLR